MPTYGTKYFSRIVDLSGNTYQINLKKADYSGSSTEIISYDIDPLVLSYKGGRDEIDSTVKGSELNFTFYAKAADDYTDLLESEYKDWQIDLTRSSVLIWRGWLQPDNISTRYEPLTPDYFISISAVDGIANLKDVDYPYKGLDTGTTSHLLLTRNILAQTDIPLDFKSQMNIYTPPLANTTLLNNLLINERRFVEYEKKIKFVKCYEALEWLYNPFNACIAQVNGNYQIWQKNEVKSNLINYNWNDFSNTTVENDRVIDVSNIKSFAGSDDFSKIRPNKTLGLTFNNRDGGRWVTKSVFQSSPSFNISATGVDVPVTYQASNTEVIMDYSTFNLEFSDPNLSGAQTTFFNVRTGSTFSLRFDLSIDLITWANSYSPRLYPKFQIDFYRFNFATLAPEKKITIIRDFPKTGETNTIIENFKYDLDGRTGGTFFNFIFRIIIPTPVPSNTNFYRINRLKVKLKNMFIFNNYDTSVKSDVLFEGLNLNSKAVNQESQDIYLGDSTNTFDVGALQYGSSQLTSSWFNNKVKTRFVDSEFTGSTLNQWANDGNGITWILSGAGDVRAINSGSGLSFSKNLLQGVFERGTYTISYRLRNLSSGFPTLNGYFYIVTKKISTGAVDYRLVNAGIPSSSSFITDTIDHTIDEDSEIGFQAQRLFGNDLNFTIDYFRITNSTTNQDGLKLMELNTKNKLLRSSKFRSYLRVAFQNAGNIQINNILKFQNKLWDVIGLEYSVMTCRYNLDLVERLPANVDISIQSTPLIDE